MLRDRWLVVETARTKETTTIESAVIIRSDDHFRHCSTRYLVDVGDLDVMGERFKVSFLHCDLLWVVGWLACGVVRMIGGCAVGVVVEVEV
jgi:hypothetical protein